MKKLLILAKEQNEEGGTPRYKVFAPKLEKVIKLITVVNLDARPPKGALFAIETQSGNIEPKCRGN